MAYVAATTGCRRGELCGLRWPDIDAGSLTVTVRRSITETMKGIHEKDPKTHYSSTCETASASTTSTSITSGTSPCRRSPAGLATPTRR